MGKKENTAGRPVETSRLARIYAVVAGLAGVYIAGIAFFDSESLAQVFPGVDVDQNTNIVISWAIRNLAISFLLLFAAFYGRPVFLFTAILARFFVDIGDILVVVTSDVEIIGTIPIGIMVIIELFLLGRLARLISLKPQ